MKRSTDRILTTHTGSLPRPPDFAELLLARERGEPIAPERFEAESRRAVADCVARQLETGLDVVNDGEQAKPSYATYVIDRLSGFDGERRRKYPTRLDSADFPDWARQKAPRGLAALRVPTCTGPIGWKDFEAVRFEIECMREAVRSREVEEVFLTAASPGVIANMLPNEHYASDADYLQAMADVMRDEYEAIVEAGFLLQVDCPDLAMGRHAEFSALSLGEFKRVAAMHVEILNGALARIDPERMRMHVCWGNYEGPHNHDVPLHEIAPIILGARPAALCLEGSNPRHGHEWKTWREIPLPKDKLIVTGCLDTTTNFVEHPELVADRIVRYAEVVGRERVIAGVDCGFGTMVGLEGVEPSVAWAKLRALVEGAEIASRVLF
ncbi:MAG: cobalamin-independent methionine synthase II family protein [Spirochaetaceae bacterium]|nr:cobalamin-independent methionine synthase II family protein [Spirochaetaceae bacterium]HPG25039.1 cobalamin-independent methionine synthase II family protein [Myxococcota bacterium]